MLLRAAKKSANDISLEECVGTDKEGNNMTFSDILPADTEDFSEAVSLKINIKKMYTAMHELLTPDERNILCWRYGLDNRKRKTQKEISELLGISRSYVSRIEKRAIRKLSQKIDE